MIFGFLGSGKMASALVRGLVESGTVEKENVLVTDSHGPAAAGLANAVGVRAVGSNQELSNIADVIILCVKPGDALAALRELELADKLVISIAAGLSLQALEEAAGPDSRVIRVMPNTPALIHKGAAAYAKGIRATEKDAQATESIFGAVGSVVAVKENLLDVVTGLSGSGPAFVYLMIEALADGGVLMGLPRELAIKLAAQTVAGSAEMVLQTGLHPATLRDQVTSPGGTTIAGIEALEANGARFAFINAVRAATERAREMGRGS